MLALALCLVAQNASVPVFTDDGGFYFDIDAKLVGRESNAARATINSLGLTADGFRVKDRWRLQFAKRPDTGDTADITLSYFFRLTPAERSDATAAAEGLARAIIDQVAHDLSAPAVDEEDVRRVAGVAAAKAAKTAMPALTSVSADDGTNGVDIVTAALGFEKVDGALTLKNSGPLAMFANAFVGELADNTTPSAACSNNMATMKLEMSDADATSALAACGVTPPAGALPAWWQDLSNHAGSGEDFAHAQFVVTRLRLVKERSDLVAKNVGDALKNVRFDVGSEEVNVKYRQALSERPWTASTGVVWLVGLDDVTTPVLISICPFGSCMTADAASSPLFKDVREAGGHGVALNLDRVRRMLTLDLGTRATTPVDKKVSPLNATSQGFLMGASFDPLGFVRFSSGFYAFENEATLRWTATWYVGATADLVAAAEAFNILGLQTAKAAVKNADDPSVDGGIQ